MRAAPPVAPSSALDAAVRCSNEGSDRLQPSAAAHRRAGSSADIMGLNSFIHLNAGPELIFMSSVLNQTCELDFDAVVQILAGDQIFSQTGELELLNVMFLTRKR